MSQYMDDKRFSVEIVSYASDAYADVVEFLAKNFKIDNHKAAALLQRLPKVITKPLGEAQAHKILQRLQNAGIDARLISQGGHSDDVPLAAAPQTQSSESPESPSREAWQQPAGVAASSMMSGAASPHDSFDDTGTASAVAPNGNNLGFGNDNLDDGFDDSDFDDFDDADFDDADMNHAGAAANFSGPPTGDAASFSGPPSSDGATFSGPPSSDGASFSGPPGFSGPPAGSVSPDKVATGDGVDEELPSSRQRRRGSILRKFLSAIIFPSLLSIVGIVIAIFFQVSPALRDQLLTSARQPAEATVRNLSQTLRDSNNTVNANVADIRDQERLTAVQRAIAEARGFVGGQNVIFMLATDPQGNYISGWFDNPQGFFVNDLTPKLQEIAPQLAEQEEVDVLYKDSQGNNLDIIGRRLSGPNGSLGGLFVGVDDNLRQQEVRKILWSTLAVLLIPLILAILWGVLLGRGVTRNIRTLAAAADDLSRGNLDANIQVESNDEIAELADAFERLRTSLRVAFERMRRRRNK